MAGAVSMSLDEIISSKRKTRGGRVTGGFRSGGISRGRGGRRGNGTSRFYTKAVPEGPWKHDLYKDLDEDLSEIRINKGSGGNPRVRLLLSNLAPTVNKADLEELFDEYKPEEVTVHYNESGEAVGTGDAILRKNEAIRLMQELKGLAIDKVPVKMTLVDETKNTVGTIRDRIDIRGGERGPNLRRTVAGGIRKRRSPSGRPPYILHDDRVPLDTPEDRLGGGGGGGGRRGGRGGRRGGGRREKKPMSEAELNAQLEAYMSGKNAREISME